MLTRGYAIAIFSASILSTAAIFIRYLTLTYQLPALILAFWRALFVVVTLFLILATFRSELLRVNRLDIWFLIIYGFVLAIFNSLWTLSVTLNGAAISTVLAYSSAGFTALLGWWFFNERLDWGKIFAVSLSLGGCVLVSDALNIGDKNANFVGIFTGILSGLFYAIYSLMGRSASKKAINPWTTLLYTFNFAAIFLLLFNLIPDGLLPGTAVHAGDFLWLGKSISGWSILFLLAAGPTLAGFGLYNISLGYLPSSVANLTVSLEPAFTTTIAYFLFGEVLTKVQIIGSLMVLAAVVFLRMHEGRLARGISDKMGVAVASS